MGELQRRLKVENRAINAYAWLGIFIFIGCALMVAVYIYVSGIMPVTSQETYDRLNAYSIEVDAAEPSLARTEFIAIALFSLPNKALTYSEARQLDRLYDDINGQPSK